MRRKWVVASAFLVLVASPAAFGQAITFAENFEGGGLGAYVETDPAGLPAATLWHGEGSCDGITPIPASMGIYAASYNQGDIAVYTYDTGGVNTGAIESPVIPSAGPAVKTLSFEYTKQTEGGGSGSFDQCFVEARPVPGAYASMLQVVGNSVCPTSTGVTVAVSTPPGPWQHRFRFNTVDAVGNAFQGWTVDNVVATESALLFAENFEGGGLGAYVETDPTGAPAATLWHGEALCTSPTYAVTAVAPGAFASIVGSPTAVLLHGALVDDSLSPAAALPIPFSYFGVPRASFRVDSNGPVSFGGVAGSDFTNDPIPAAAAPNDYLAGWWDDLHTGAAGSVLYDVVGGDLVIEWNSVQHFPNNLSGENATLQVVLHSGSNAVEFRYDGATFSVGADLWTATVGVEGPGGASGVDPTGLDPGNAVFPATNYVLTPTGGGPLVPIPASMGVNAAAYNQGDIAIYTYATVGGNTGAIESPVLASAVNAHLTLSFDYMKETEGGGTTAFDQCFVEAKPAGPGAYGVVMQIAGNAPCPVAPTSVSTLVCNVPGGLWQHRFRFNTIDGVSNAYSGWYVDNVLSTQRPGTAGGFITVPTGCGGGPFPVLTPTGNPVIGGTVTLTMGAPLNPVMWLGAPTGAFPLCPPAGCALGASLSIVLPTSVIVAPVPCDPSLVGGSIAVQGANILGPGGCGVIPFGVPFTVTNTVLVTIG